MIKVCSSCKKDVGSDTGTAIFLCPNCGKTEVVRCSHCRKLAARYTCAECGFSGPN